MRHAAAARRAASALAAAAPLPSTGAAAAASALSPASALLSDLTVHSKYARYVPALGRREVWPEIVERNRQMHRDHLQARGVLTDALQQRLERVYALVQARRVLPSMRSLQFGGRAVAANHARMFNCSYLPLDSVRAFSEAMFLLLSGTGVGYSVQRHHIARLPLLRRPDAAASPVTHVVDDSIEGWAQAAQALLASYLPDSGQPQREVRFDYSQVRPRGALLKTAGGRAPGPEPLAEALEHARRIFDAALDRSLSSSKDAPVRIQPLDAHDVMCHLATAVASGGIRRSALIALFSADDEGMMRAKVGPWWEKSPQRALSNNSAVLDRTSVSPAYFQELWRLIRESGSGEPGIYFSNDREWGTNPCCEIALEPFQFCNLTEINVSDVDSQESLEQLAAAGAFLGTLQASYTDFGFLSPQWAETTRRGALLGVSMTGIASGRVMGLDLQRAAQAAIRENERIAGMIGINPAQRVTTVKPAGTTSLVLGTSSGVHAWHAPHYIRRIRMNKDEDIYHYIAKHRPELLEDDVFAPDRQAVLSFPQKAPPGAILRGESALSLLERVRQLHSQWIRPGHRSGANTNNVSTTVSVRPDEWDAVGEWMWRYRDSYNGLCVLPYSDHTYKQPPFEECDEATYNRLAAHAFDIDLTQIREASDETDFGMAPACAGGSCEI